MRNRLLDKGYKDIDMKNAKNKIDNDHGNISRSFIRLFGIKGKKREGVKPENFISTSLAPYSLLRAQLRRRPRQTGRGGARRERMADQHGRASHKRRTGNGLLFLRDDCLVKAKACLLGQSRFPSKPNGFKRVKRPMLFPVPLVGLNDALAQGEL
jgi:hypothetical protein